MEPELWRQVEQLFHAALKVEESEREEFVRQACAENDELRREVQSLLAHHHEGGSFIETPAFVEPSASRLRARSVETSSTKSGATKSDVLGTVISHYRVLSKIGRGGMGVVYDAEDLSLGRRVALKFLPEELADDPQSLRRFHREARSASALNHPNICTIYEVGKGDSRAFIAMEFIEGRTLRELLVAGSLPIRKATEIAAQIAEGLTKAHENGIAHRDLKPENLMVSQDNFVKILDFGLAIPTSEGDEHQEHTRGLSQTLPGLVVGTAGYMSPEQASGGRVDFRSDQFSFGLVMYEMVTGKRAFRRGTTAETLAAILRDQPTPVGMQNPDAPAPLCWVIERCLAKEPDKRYVSTRDLARELVAIRDCFSEKPAKQGEYRAPNLPAQRTGFVGREKEIASARELLSRERLVTITGPGGIGKTRLAVEVASGMVESFPDGIHFVPLSSLTDPGLISSLIVQTLGMGEAGQAPIEKLTEYLQDSSRGSMLLVLDNFEHLIQAASTVAKFLAMGPNLKILVTSRAALHVYGEHEFPVPPLGLPDSPAQLRVEVLSECPAVALFVQRAVAARPDFKLTQENASDVAEICARLDGLPLAIELAAARIKVLSPASLRTRLASRLQLLTGGARDLPQRQQTLRAAMDWSYDLLTPAEQMLFRRLSVFVGGCSLEAVEAVCDTKADLALDLLDGMASMVDKSLVQQVQVNGESRFVMLETIREYAMEKLETSGEKAATKRAHAAYGLVLAEEEATEHSSGGSEWLERFDLEHDNFRASLDWLTETGDADWGMRLGTALFRFWEMREYLAEGRDRLGKLLKLAGAAGHTKARMRTLFSAGVLAGAQGDYRAASQLTNESLEIARRLGDKQEIAVSLNALAVHTRDQGDAATAQTLFEQSLALWRELDDQNAIARSLSNLANVAKLRGDYASARALYTECLAIFETLGDRTGVAWSMNHQGDVVRGQGDSNAARKLYEDSLSIFRELKDRWGIAGTLADLGNLAREQGDFSTAHTLYKESIETFLGLDHKRGIARLLESFACSAAAQLDAERSLLLAGAAAALRHNVGAPLTPAEQVKLDTELEPSRKTLTGPAGTKVWLEGWGMGLDRAIAEASLPESTRTSRGSDEV
jgi:predicted ATPase/tRNA A-37 threonylcarbamoyl transferase component Bud32